MCLNQAGNLLHLFITGVSTAITNIIPYGAAEQIRRLQYIADMGMQPAHTALS